METTQREKPESSLKDLGQMLVKAELITAEQLESVKDIQAKGEYKLERVLLQERLITPQQLAFFTSLQLRVPFVNLRKEGVSPNAVAMIPEPIARKYSVIPIEVTDGTLVLAMEDPRDIQSIEELSTLTRKRP